ncbi:MAG: sulfatase [Planctomycetales bacterium]
MAASRCFLSYIFIALLLVTGSLHSAKGAERLPNIIVIYNDDQGYGDVGCYGAKGFKTPNMDRLAREGTRYTNFHVSQPVCSASRASLLTGCYSPRVSIHGALGPRATHGIHDRETTIAEVLKTRGYATGMAGKWHLGHLPQAPCVTASMNTTASPFQRYVAVSQRPETPGLSRSPPVRREKVIDSDVTVEDQRHPTTKANRAVQFIEKNKERPFFFYLANTMPHVPLFVSDKYQDKSEQGRYGDVIEEIDWGIGQILETLDRLKLADNTFIMMSSDNGPWLSYGNHGGSAGPLREGKGTCWEGGVRVPCLIRWPGKIPAGAVNDRMWMTIDLLPTLAGRVGASLPALHIDGEDVWPLISGNPKAANPHEAYFYWYEQSQLQAVVSGDGHWKLQFPHVYRTLNGGPGGKDGMPVRYESKTITAPELYDLQNDVGETKDVAAAHPDIVHRLTALAETMRDELGDTLTKKVGKDVRLPGQVQAKK